MGTDDKSRLKKAIASGLSDAVQIEFETRKKVEDARKQEMESSRRRYELYVKRLGDGSAIYSLIREFVKEERLYPPRKFIYDRFPSRTGHVLGPNHLQVLVGDTCVSCKELAQAINTFSGLKAYCKSGTGHINSDEVEEYWEHIVLDWDRS